MKAKDKALVIYHKFRGFNNETTQINYNTAIQCALICVSEIKSALISYGEDSDELQNMDS